MAVSFVLLFASSVSLFIKLTGSLSRSALSYDQINN